LGVVVRAYSSSANLGPGFDALAVALDGYSDVVEVRASNEPGVRVEVHGEYASSAGGGETARIAVEELLNSLGVEQGITIRIEKGIPPGRGLGSSGASASGAVAGVAKLLGLDIPAEVLVEAAGAGEAAAAGSPHYDNVAASLLGGFIVLARGVKRLRVLRIDAEAWLAIVTPMDPVPENKTMVMRSVLPREVSLTDALSNWSRLAMLVAALAEGRLDLVGEMMMGDGIIEPRRSKYIPCYMEMRREALNSGALGYTISGAGPSVIALTDSPASARTVLDAMLSSCRWKVEPLGRVARVAPGAIGQG